jgi:hypothetical protein
VQEESLKKELRAALRPRRGRQPRNLLTTDPKEAGDQQESAPIRKPAFFVRLFRRR